MSLMNIFRSVLPVKQQLADNLSALDSLVLQGSLLLDLSIIANIPANVISEPSYGSDITVNVLVNRFESAASFGSESFSLELPISLPLGDGSTINFNLSDASFLLDLFLSTPDPIDILELFLDNQNSTSVSLEYGGSFKANLPLTVGIAGVNIGVDLMIIDGNIFEPDPVVDYAIDLCEVSAAMIDLFGQLKAQVVEALETPFAGLDIKVNIDKIADPLVQRVDNVLANFTKGMNVAFSAADCYVLSTIHPSENPSNMPSEASSSEPSHIPSTQPSSDPSVEPSSQPSDGPTSTPSVSPSMHPSDFPTLTPSSNPSLHPSLNPSEGPSTVGLVKTIKDAIKAAISSVNEELEALGVSLSADVLPYFNTKTFSVGVSVSLGATITQTAAEVIDVVSDYIEFSTDPSADPGISKLGLGYSNDAPNINLDDLLSKVSLGAGLDVTFGIDFSLAEIQNGIFTSHPLGKALRKGISLQIDTWGAFAEIIVNPIDLDLTLFGKDIHIRDSHFAIAAEIRSRGKFVASIDDMIVGSSAINTAPLLPNLTVPLSTEFILDIPLTDGIVLSPIMSVENENLIESDFVFDLDVDIGTFLNNDYVGENTLTSLLQTAIIFLQQVSALELEVNATADSVPSSLTGFFNMVNELDDLADEFLTYVDLVNEGKELIDCMLYPYCSNMAQF